MATEEELSSSVAAIFNDKWTTKNGATVPDDTSLTFANTGIYLDATVLYADLSESTGLVDGYRDTFASEVYKAFLRCSSRLITHHGGSITAYDGDRVMGVFLGNLKNTNAAKTGLRINWACSQVIQPAINRRYKTEFQIRHTVGIDTSRLLVVKAGVRGSNDLVWVGRAANWAAKLTSLSPDYPTRITKAVYDKLANEAKISNGGHNMWESVTWNAMNGAEIYRSTWRWAL